MTKTQVFSFVTWIAILVGASACAVDDGQAPTEKLARSQSALTEADNDWVCWRWTDETRTQVIYNSRGGGKLRSACEVFNTEHPRDPWSGLVPLVTCQNQAVGAPDTSYSCPWWGYWGSEPMLVNTGTMSCGPGQTRIGDDGSPIRLPDGTMVSGGICVSDALVVRSCQPTSCAVVPDLCGSMPDGCGGTIHCFHACNFPEPQFQCSFQWEYYLSQNPDLGAAGINDANGARVHYDLHGRSEGRRCNAICSPCE